MSANEDDTKSENPNPSDSARQGGDHRIDPFDLPDHLKPEQPDVTKDDPNPYGCTGGRTARPKVTTEPPRRSGAGSFAYGATGRGMGNF